MSRENALEKTRIILLNQAVSAILSEKASRQFKKTLDSMGD